MLFDHLQSKKWHLWQVERVVCKIDCGRALSCARVTAAISNEWESPLACVTWTDSQRTSNPSGGGRAILLESGLTHLITLSSRHRLGRELKQLSREIKDKWKVGFCTRVVVDGAERVTHEVLLNEASSLQLVPVEKQIQWKHYLRVRQHSWKHV